MNDEYFLEINKLLNKVNNYPYESSKLWTSFMLHLRSYLQTGDLELYHINNVVPHIFKWPEDSGQNMRVLEILESEPESIFYKVIQKSNDYGPKNIKLYKNVQLDRVQQTWSIYILCKYFKFNIENDEILFEFGGGTGQMADVLTDLNFKGRHIVYDLPEITVLQNYFIKKRGISTNFILDDEPMNIINGTNYLPCNQKNSEVSIVKMPDVNFIATYSLSETDADTHSKFTNYMSYFSRIYMTYLPGSHYVGDYVNNDEFIQNIINKISDTHYHYIGTDYGGCKSFLAVKKEIVNNIYPF